MTTFEITGYYGLLRVNGANRLDFMHRMSTGALAALKPGTGAATCFTTPNGRIVDYSIVLADVDSALLLTGGGNEDKLLRWLRKYVFYNDAVQLEIVSAAFRAVAYLPELLPDDTNALPLYAHVVRDAARWVRMELGTLPMALALSEATDVQPGADIAAFDALRIAQGVPRFPNELSEDYIPLEAGLWDSVSFSKGCYIGQEIIARMESRNQISKKLVQLLVKSGSVSAGEPLLAGSDTVGRVTSSTGARALGYVRSTAIDAGRELLAPAGSVQIVLPQSFR